MKKSKTDIKEVFSGEEIILKDLFLIIWERKHVFLISSAIMLVIAITSILTTPEYYTSSSSYLTEQVSAKSNPTQGVSNLFGLPSINLSKSPSNFSDPAFFPKIIESQPYLVKLIQDSLYFENEGEYIQIQEYLSKYDDRNAVNKLVSFLKGQVGRIFKVFKKEKRPAPELPPLGLETKSDDVDSREVDDELQIKQATPILDISENQLTAMTNLTEMISVSSQGKILNITAELDDRVACAQLNQLVSTSLLNFVTENETIKERRDLDFTERRVAIANEKFLAAQLELAEFKDKNIGVVSARIKSDEQRLEYEYQIAFGLYSTLATELEEKKIRLVEKIPVFTVFEPVYLPITPSSTSSLKKTILYLFLGVFMGALWIVGVIVKNLV